MLCTIVGLGQPQFVIPGYVNSYQDMQWGDSYVTTITNNSQSPLCLFAQLDGFGESTERIFLSDSATMVWLLSRIDEFAPVEIQKIQAIEAIETILKSPLFMNRHLILYEDRSYNLTAKKFAWLSAHSFYNQQCGDYARRLVELLLRTGLFSPNELRGNNIDIVENGSFSGLHVVAECVVFGNFAKIDPDPGTPRTQELTMFGDYASVDDIVADTLLVHDQVYKWVTESGDSIRLVDQTISQYRSCFGESHPFTFFHQGGDTYPLSGIITLPPGSEMSAYYREDQVLIDLSHYTPEELEMMDSLYHTSDPSVIIEGVVSLTGLSEQVVAEALSEGNIHRMPIPYWPAFNRCSMLPYMSIHVFPSSDTIKIGRDLIAPFVVKKTKVISGGPVTLGANVITDQMEVFLFDTSEYGSPGRMSPMIRDNEMNYLTEGFIPPNTEVVFTCFYNPRYYDFWKGFTCDVLCGSIPSLEQEFVPGQDYITLISESFSKELFFYPNPVRAGSQMKGLQDSVVYNSSGQIVSISDYAPLVPGLYFVIKDSEVQKLIITP